MQKVIVSVKDTISEVFHDIRVEINAASAIRAFSRSVEESKDKDDFSLYILGEFNSMTGEITKCEPTRIYTGHDVRVNNVEQLKENA